MNIKTILITLSMISLIALSNSQTQSLRLTDSVEGYGQFLTDNNEYTLYIYQADQGQTKSQCSGECLKAWPPMLIPKSDKVPTAGAGVNAAMISTIDYNDTEKLVTYNGWPLYFYKDEMVPSKKGQAMCQAKDMHGGLWYIIRANGLVNFQLKNKDVATSNTPTLKTWTLTSNAAFGAYLTDSQGIALYMFEKDSFMKSNCYSTCAGVWPPYLFTSTTAAQPTISSNLDAKLVALSKRTDGTSMLAYNGWPLYYYQGEKDNKTTNSVKCQDVTESGGKWWVMKPDGSINKSAKPSTGTSTSVFVKTSLFISIILLFFIF